MRAFPLRIPSQPRHSGIDDAHDFEEAPVLTAGAMTRVICAASAMLIAATHAHAEDKAISGASASAGEPISVKAPEGSKAAWDGDLTTRSNLLGDIAGLRPLLDRYGISFGLSETSETLGNINGGVRRGAILEGLTQMSLGADLSKSIGLEGSLLNISGFQIHGRGLTSRNLDNLNVVSSIEADPATRLNELWFQQSFMGGKLDIKIGQQSADLEFITSEYEDLFINSGFGWPTLPATDLPSGGPAYPLATPGLRLRAMPRDGIVALVGVFDGSPAGLHPGNPQANDASGTNFDVSSGALVIGEIQYSANKDKDATGLPATYKIGAWYNSNRFANPFFANAAPPVSEVALPTSRRGDWSIYGTLDQLVFRSKNSDGGFGITARAMAAPGDRNLIDLFIQGGVTYKGVLGRSNDTIGLALEWAHVSDVARTGDVTAALTSGYAIPARSSETVFEATYQAQIEPWWQVQPDLQYIRNPGGGLADLNRPLKRIDDAVVLGIRSVVTF